MFLGHQSGKDGGQKLLFEPMFEGAFMVQLPKWAQVANWECRETNNNSDSPQTGLVLYGNVEVSHFTPWWQHIPTPASAGRWHRCGTSQGRVTMIGWLIEIQSWVLTGVLTNPNNAILKSEFALFDPSDNTRMVSSSLRNISSLSKTWIFPRGWNRKKSWNIWKPAHRVPVIWSYMILFSRSWCRKE